MPNQLLAGTRVAGLLILQAQYDTVDSKANSYLWIHTDNGCPTKF